MNDNREQTSKKEINKDRETEDTAKKEMRRQNLLTRSREEEREREKRRNKQKEKDRVT